MPKSTRRTYRYIIRKGAEEHSIEDVRNGTVYDLSSIDLDTKNGRDAMANVSRNLSREMRLPVNV